MSEPESHYLPVSQTDPHAIVIGTIGTSGFALGTLLTWFGRDWPVFAAHPEWLPICACGVLLGLIGLAYCFHRRRSAAD